MRINFDVLVSNKTKKTELIAIAVITAMFVVFFRKIFAGQLMFSHDSIRWYGIYHLFADSLLNGVFPYWDPYGFCGQPFYYNLGILRFYEPVTMAFIMLSKVFNVNILSIYHWEYMTRIWLSTLGVYFCYRQVNKYVMSNLIVFGVFLFSSFTVTSLRQNGFLYVFCWTPWVIFFLLRLLKNFSLYNIIGFSFFTGLTLSSYQGVYLLTFIFIFMLTLCINDRGYLVLLLKNKKNLILIVVAILIIIILAFPLFTVAIEQNKIVPTARLDDGASIAKGIKLDYKSISKAGTHSNPIDFFELICPVAARGFFVGKFGGALNVSECFLYIGIYPLLLCIVGMLFSRGKYRINFIITLIVIGLLMLGPMGGVHRILYHLFYPLRLARHMHLFSGFFIFTLFYFLGQGADFILKKIITENKKC